MIRLEHPVYGDPNRLVGWNLLNEERMNTYYLCINSGKKAMTLNLADPAGQKIFRDLIQELKVDIFATNQLPRNYEKLGIDYETIKAIKPDIIWLGITGFGPQSNEPAYDPILQARSGLMDLTGEKEGEPYVTGIPLPDMGTSEHCYGLVMKALYKREVTGEGSYMNMSMYESSLSWITIPITFTCLGQTITRRGNTHEFFAPLSVYRTNDGYIYLAVGNDRQWKAMVSQQIFQSLDKPEYETNTGRIGDVPKMNTAINEITKNHSSAELIELFNAIMVPVSKINSIPEVLADPLVQQRLLSAEDPITGTKITMPPAPNLTPYLEGLNRRLSFPPRFGEHNKDIIGGILGYSDDELEQFKERKII